MKSLALLSYRCVAYSSQPPACLALLFKSYCLTLVVLQLPIISVASLSGFIPSMWTLYAHVSWLSAIPSYLPSSWAVFYHLLTLFLCVLTHLHAFFQGFNISFPALQHFFLDLFILGRIRTTITWRQIPSSPWNEYLLLPELCCSLRQR